MILRRNLLIILVLIFNIDINQAHANDEYTIEAILKSPPILQQQENMPDSPEHRKIAGKDWLLTYFENAQTLDEPRQSLYKLTYDSVANAVYISFKKENIQSLFGKVSSNASSNSLTCNDTLTVRFCISVQPYYITRVQRGASTEFELPLYLQYFKVDLPSSCSGTVIQAQFVRGQKTSVPTQI